MKYNIWHIKHIKIMIMAWQVYIYINFISKILIIANEITK